MHKKKMAVLIACLMIPALTACSEAAGESAPEENQAAYQAIEADEDQTTENLYNDDSNAPASKGIAVAEVILGGYSTKSFSDASVSDEDLRLILEAGLKAPSARNSQPWHFIVLRNSQTVQKYVSAATEGTIMIIVAGLSEAPEGVNVSYDCGLATENMYITAQSLGLGTHIYAAPVSFMNADRESLQIPEGYNAVAAILIGYSQDSEDAISSASVRNDFEKAVTIVE